MAFPKTIEDAFACIADGVNNNTLLVTKLNDKDGREHYVLAARTGEKSLCPLAILREDLIGFFVPPNGEVEVLKSELPSAAQILNTMAAIEALNQSTADGVFMGPQKPIVN